MANITSSACAAYPSTVTNGSKQAVDTTRQYLPNFFDSSYTYSGWSQYSMHYSVSQYPQNQQGYYYYDPEKNVYYYYNPPVNFFPDTNSTNGKGGVIPTMMGRIGNVRGVRAKPKWDPIVKAHHQRAAKMHMLKCAINSLRPKTPHQAIEEVLGHPVMYEYREGYDEDYEKFHEEHHYYPEYLTTCRAIVYDKIFAGMGPSKLEARAACADKIFPWLVCKKVEEQNMKPRQVNTDGSPVMFEQMEDEVPWFSLCSVALYNLFEDWKAEGFTVPDQLLTKELGVGRVISDNQDKALQRHSISPHEDRGQHSVGQYFSLDQNKRNGVNSESASEVPNAQIELPHPIAEKVAEANSIIQENPSAKPPLLLLNELAPVVNYEISVTGIAPYLLFKAEATVHGRTFIGEAKNKKDARRLCACEALRTLFRITYPPTKGSTDLN